MKKICVSLFMGVTLISCSHKRNSSFQIPYPEVISTDTANKMIGSYLASIDYQHEDSNLRAVVFDARVLRHYLDSMTTSNDVEYIKIMFAHTLNYINSGHQNQFAGYRSGALTFIIAGYNTDGNYVFLPSNLVIDNASPCPANCPPGEAGNALFSTSNKQHE